MRTPGIILMAVGILWAQDTPPVVAPAAQEPPALVNSGKPMTLPFRCTAEDIHAAGLECTDEDPCPVYLELSAVQTTGIRIFAAGNIHTASATLYGILIGSEDNGHTWREVFERVRGAGLDHLQFQGVESGWASGQVVYPLPRDPFVLQTTDGGKTWRQHPVFNEPGFGAIQQFWFSDAKNGALIVDHGARSEGDRYELYESPDGGDSWSIKESSVKPIRLRQAPAAPPAAEWRLRADGPSKSFHIEHREGSRWATVGAFSVSLGPCKPE